ncbi:hypothetical protein [uncultured Friedmanniella sp.]|uniref:hypothetical protein n=1 Tax=uncultured Friedmanniella sp. TaxID=335381 RepID=UPI0035CB2247
MSQLDFFDSEEYGRIPFWENYLVCQAVQASLGRYPPHATAIGIEVKGRNAIFHFQMPYASQEDEEEMLDILDEFETIAEVEVHVSRHIAIRSERQTAPSDGVTWIYLSRTK